MANVRAERVCSECGETFRPTQHRQQRCAPCIHAPRLRATPIPWAECKWCGTWIIRRWGRAYCSNTCRQYANARTTVTRIAFVDCAHCAAPFTRRVAELGRYCTDRCRKKADKRHRRHIARSGGSERIDVATLALRDGWECGICGEPVDPDATAPAAWSATIDHRTPITRGGTHDWSNVQLAHFWCNSAKGSDPMFTLQSAA